MKQVETITLSELSQMAAAMYGTLVKAVVDLEHGILVVDSELHVDQEQFLLEQGSDPTVLWGINLYPQNYGTTGFIEFDSMINIRPRQHNLTRGVEDPEIRKRIEALVLEKVME